MENKQIKRIENVANSRKKKLDTMKHVSEKVRSEEKNQQDLREDYENQLRAMKSSRHRSSVDLDNAQIDAVKLLERGWNKRNFTASICALSKSTLDLCLLDFIALS
jgi:hypothetical protein